MVQSWASMLKAGTVLRGDAVTLNIQSVAGNDKSSSREIR